MNEIAGPPSKQEFGHSFSYAQWTKHTVMTMVNVPWNSDYRDVVRFASQKGLDDWIDGQPVARFTDMSLLKFNQNVKVNMPLNRAMKFNYVRAANPTMPVPGDVARSYYYFVTDIVYRTPMTTELILQLDVFQTFGYDVTLGRCFVERGHIGIANTRQFDHYGRDYLTVPEGLDVGGEYRVVHSEFERIMDIANETDGYDALVWSTLDLTQDPGTIDDPALDSSPGGQFQGLPSGASPYIFPTSYDLRTFFLKYKDKPWITQGVVSITLIPNIKRYYPDFDYGTNLSPDSSFKYYSAWPNSGNQPTLTPHAQPLLADWRDKQFIENILGDQYKHLKKFLTYPYMVLELTTWSGSPAIIKPESWQDADATIKELAAFMPPGQRIVAYPVGYNADGETSAVTQTDNDLSKDGDFINMAVFFDNFPSLPIVNNMAAAFLAANKNGLAFEFRSADWSQTRALRGADVGYGQASAGMALQNQLTGISTGATSAQAALQASTLAQQAIIGAAGDVAGGAVGGGMMGPAGVAFGAAGGAVQGVAGMVGSAVQQQQVTGAAQIGNAAAQSANESRVGTAGYMRDTNRDLAQFSANGDYANTVAGINAKIQDARLSQPSVSGQFGGDAFNLINGLFGYSLRWKMPSLNVLRTVGAFWLRYGYAINQYMNIPTNFMCMEKFTYWKLTETYISQAPIPESFKQVIRGIFEKGVTVWSDPAFIGNTPVSDNDPLTGFSY